MTLRRFLKLNSEQHKAMTCTITANLQSVKIQLANNKAASDAKLMSLKATVGQMKESLSACADDAVELKIKFEGLAAQFSKL